MQAALTVTAHAYTSPGRVQPYAYAYGRQRLLVSPPPRSRPPTGLAAYIRRTMTSAVNSRAKKLSSDPKVGEVWAKKDLAFRRYHANGHGS